MSSFLSILQFAWRTAIRERRLWWYALPAGFAIGSGFGSAIAQALHGSLLPLPMALFAEPWVATIGRVGAIWDQARATGIGATIATVAFAVLLACFALAMVWLIVACANVLILAVGYRLEGKPMPRALLRAVADRWAPAFAVHLMAQVVAWVVLRGWSAIIGSIGIVPSIGETIRLTAGFVVTVLVLSAWSVLTVLALVGVVLDHQRPVVAMRNAFIALRDRWLALTLVSALLTIANAASLAVWIGGTFVLALPFLFIGGIGVSMRSGAVIQGATVTGMPVLVAFSVLLAVIFTVFITAAWVSVSRKPEAGSWKLGE